MAATGHSTAERAALLDVLRGRARLEEAAERAGLSVGDLDHARRRFLASKLPPESLTLHAGVGAPVRIVRDRAGVPHILADRSRDLFFGYGLALAQDRLWQIDYLRRRALGRLAEVLGPEAVASDRRNRLLGFGRLADAELAALSEEAAVALDGFAAGINAWIEQVRDTLPVEFNILEYAPEAWSPRDSIALMRAFFWQLTGRLENIAAGEAARRVLGDELAADFLTTEAPAETIVPRDDASGRSTEAGGTSDTRRARAGLGATGGSDAAGGSNNWAVAPARSATGSALLASDPHLPFSLPTGLYQVHLRGAGYDAAGAGYPGTPNIWFGHNDRVAWGLTNLVASPRDLYVEAVNPANPSQYRDGDGWALFETREEEIVVRGAPAERLVVRSTARGPVVDELLPGLDGVGVSSNGTGGSTNGAGEGTGGRTGRTDGSSGPGGVASVDGTGGTALSLRWVGQEQLGDVQAALDVARARDWTSFRRALSGWRLPIFNFVYADVDGHIGWQAAGSVPIRGDGDTTRGYRPANDPAHVWRGYVAFDDLPRLEDPARGWVGTANNRPIDPAEQRAPLYGWWAPGHRAVRLRRLLDGDGALTPEDMRAMHADTYSVRAEQAVPRLRELLGGEHGGSAGARLLELLDGWDYRVDPDSRGAIVFEAFFERWHERALAARFPDSARPFLTSLGAGSGLALRLLAEGRPADWFGTDASGVSLNDLIEETAADTLRSLELRLGPDAGAWRWGALHTVAFRHPLHGRPGTEGLFSTAPAPVGGTSYVLNANSFAHDAPFGVLAGPEYRLVVGLADLDATRTILTTGQSGQPGSPYYTNMTSKWLAGEYFDLPFTPATVEAAKVGETRLEPDRSGALG